MAVLLLGHLQLSPAVLKHMAWMKQANIFPNVSQNEVHTFLWEPIDTIVKLSTNIFWTLTELPLRNMKTISWKMKYQNFNAVFWNYCYFLNLLTFLALSSLTQQPILDQLHKQLPSKNIRNIDNYHKARSLLQCTV